MWLYIRLFLAISFKTAGMHADTSGYRKSAEIAPLLVPLPSWTTRCACRREIHGGIYGAKPPSLLLHGEEQAIG